jgi:UDP-N-acetylmuramyl pentapeptide phosphotransferase/UDP-N-acetylglucosamine-1-phosphate transferase
MISYLIIFVLLVVAELIYFRIADYFNIIDKPNERSSHSNIVLRGGGMIFVIGLWIWYFWLMVQGEWSMVQEYWPLLVGVTLAAGISFVDDIHSLPDSVRLVCQLVAMFFVMQQIGLFTIGEWNIVNVVLQGLLILLVFVVYTGAVNVYNFMDGINGINGAYTIAVLIPVLIKNEELRIKSGVGFLDESLLIVVLLSLVVFCFFNFRPKGKAKCFAGDVGSVASAFIVVYALGKLIYVTGDITYGLFLAMYGVDGCLTIIHRIMLHENLGEAHRKHAYQIMANELQMGHVKVASLYAGLQLAFSLGMLALPEGIVWHWVYILSVGAVLITAYVLFMKKYYHLHEEYLASLKG